MPKSTAFGPGGERVEVLTEVMLRKQLAGKAASSVQEYAVDKDVLVTPAAKAFLEDRGIHLVREGAAAQPQDAREESALPAFEKPKQYESLTHETYQEKPEHMTALHGNVLVPKSHIRIQLRGALDSLLAWIGAVQIDMQKQNRAKLVQDLAEVAAYVREILGCEVTGRPLADIQLLGMNEQELRERSHHPKKYYGFNHFTPDYTQGEAVVRLNLLRVRVREVELLAYKAFSENDGVPSRGDIVKALNRLSSLFYVMMLRVKAKEYER